MIVLKDVDSPEFDNRHFRHGKIVKGITEALENNPDLALVYRNQRDTRDLVDLIISYDFELAMKCSKIPRSI